MVVLNVESKLLLSFNILINFGKIGLLLGIILYFYCLCWYYFMGVYIGYEKDGR